MKIKKYADVDDGIVYSNVNIDPKKAYVLFVGKYHKHPNTTKHLAGTLKKRYGKGVETIHVLPNMPSPEALKDDNFIIINKELAVHNSGNGKVNYNLPLEQESANGEASESKYLNRVLRQILRSQDDVFIDVYKNSREMKLPDGQGIHVIGPDPELVEFYDDKLNQRAVAEKLGIPVPQGYTANSFQELVQLYKEKFGGDAFVACSHSSSGKGTMKVRNVKDLYKSEKIRNGDRFIIAELLDTEFYPCTSGIVANGHGALTFGITDQILEDGRLYRGALSPTIVTDDQKGQIVKFSEKLGTRMGKDGYKGFFSVDYMIDKKGDIYFAEINPRKGGANPGHTLARKTTHPHEPSIPEIAFRAVNKGDFDFDVSDFQMSPLSWGMRREPIGKGQRTLNHARQDKKRETVYKNSGFTIVDHPGKDVVYPKGGNVARVITAINNGNDPGERDRILKTLENERARIMVA